MKCGTVNTNKEWHSGYAKGYRFARKEIKRKLAEECDKAFRAFQSDEVLQQGHTALLYAYRNIFENDYFDDFPDLFKKAAAQPSGAREG